MNGDDHSSQGFPARQTGMGSGIGTGTFPIGRYIIRPASTELDDVRQEEARGAHYIIDPSAHDGHRDEGIHNGVYHQPASETDRHDERLLSTSPINLNSASGHDSNNNPNSNNNNNNNHNNINSVSVNGGSSKDQNKNKDKDGIEVEVIRTVAGNPLPPPEKEKEKKKEPWCRRTCGVKCEGCTSYFKKWGGANFRQSPEFRLPANAWEVFWPFLGTLLGIGAVQALNFYVCLPKEDFVMVLGSFGATAVLVYACPLSPLAQPRNCIGGHTISAVIGVACQQIFPNIPFLAGTLAVAVAITVMQLTGTVHPPGGATALLAVIGSPAVRAMKWMYILVPALSGACVLVLAALIVNNAAVGRRYPTHWI